MVILVFDPHVKLIIPRNKTLLLGAQNTQSQKTKKITAGTVICETVICVLYRRRR